MRLLHVNATSHRGGAARAMRRLHNALTERGHESRFLVGRSMHPEDPLVYSIWDVVEGFTTPANRIKSRIGNQLERLIGSHPWANQNNLRIVDTDLYHWADIIDLRNLFGGFFNLWCLPALTAGKPVVWRMPDLWAVTGHCAYPYDCDRWVTGCHHCPLLRKDGRERVEPTPTLLDGSRRVWRGKKDIYQRSNLHIIVTTSWMRDQVERSILGNALSVNIISNGVDLETYRPHPQEQVRLELGLDPNEVIVLWAAGGKGNYRKGYHLAYGALERIQAETGQAPWLITMGGEEGWSRPETLKKVKHFGYIRDADMQARIYSAADAFLCTTLADGQPQTALESLACGTPVVAFDIGPMPGIALEGKTGVIVTNPTAEALANTIEQHLIQGDGLSNLRESCRAFAESNFDLKVQTGKYVSLYERILQEHGGMGEV